LRDKLHPEILTPEERKERRGKERRGEVKAIEGRGEGMGR